MTTEQEAMLQKLYDSLIIPKYETIFSRYGGMVVTNTNSGQTCTPIMDTVDKAQASLYCSNNYPEMTVSTYFSLDVTDFTKMKITANLVCNGMSQSGYNNTVRIGLSTSNSGAPTTQLYTGANISNVTVGEQIFDISSVTGKLFPSIWFRKGYPSSSITMTITKLDFE